MSQLEASMKFDPNAETAFFTETAFFKGKAAMAANNCDTALEAFQEIVQNKVRVFSEDSMRSLVAHLARDRVVNDRSALPHPPQDASGGNSRSFLPMVDR